MPKPLIHGTKSEKPKEESKSSTSPKEKSPKKK